MAIAKQIVGTLIGCLFMMNMGIMYAWPSSTIQQFSTNSTTLDRPMTDIEQALFGGIFTVTALISTSLSGVLLDVFGRKKSCVLFAIPQVVAWLIICVSNNVEVVFAAACISGMSTGLFTIIPLFISEISEETVRGTLTAAANIFWSVGVMVSYISGCLSYQMMNYTNLLVTAIGALLIVYLKESPVYLMSKGLDKDAARSIAFYRSVEMDSKEVQHQMTVIRRALNPKLDGISSEEEKLKGESQVPQKLSKMEFFRKSRSSRLVLFLVCALSFCSVFQGVVVVQVYAQPMFEEALPGISGNVTGILFTLVCTIAGVIAAYFLDFFGRRPLIIYPSIATGVSCLVLGSQIQFQWGPGWVTGVIIFSYSIAYTFGGGTVPFVVIAEVFLPEVRSILTMITLEWAWICNFLILFVYSLLVAAVGLSGVFYVFAISSFATAILCFFNLPETNAQTVDVIQTLFLQKKYYLSTLRMSVGFLYSWPSSTITMFSSTNTTLSRPMTVTEQTMFGSVFAIVALITTPLTGFLLDWIGRKNTCIIFGLPQVISWVLISTFSSVEVVLTAMCVSGIGGCIFTCVPMYISEICQESVRGTMVACVNIFYGIGIGITMSYVFGGCLDYQTMNYTCLSISVASIALMTYMKESPVYLLKTGLDEEAAKSVAFYRSVKVDSKVVIEEIEAIRRTLGPDTAGEQQPEEESLKPPKTPEKASLLQFIRKSKSTRQGLFVVTVVTFLSMFQGLAAIQVYAQPLFEKAMPSVSGNLMSICFGLINITIGFIAAYLVDIYGRRLLMIYSSVASGISCLAVATQVHFQWGPDWLTVVFLYLFCIVYTFGAGTVPYILMAEFFLPEVKSFMLMLTQEWAWVCNFLVVFIHSLFVTNFGIASAFYLFAVSCILSVVFCFYYLPETKALPVDVIQTLLVMKR